MAGKRSLFLCLLLFALLLVSCAETSEQPADASEYEAKAEYSLLPEGELPIPSYPEYDLSVWETESAQSAGNYLNFFGDVVPLYNSGSEVMSVRIGTYSSSQTEGATLEVTSDGTFSYLRTRQYTYRGEEAYSFAMTFRVSGYVLPAEGGLQLCITDATVRYNKTEESDLALNAALDGNVLYPDGSELERCRRLLAGEELTVDEFYGTGTFAMMTAEPIVAIFDSDVMAFALDRPFLPYALDVEN